MRKPKTIGSELKCVAAYITGILLGLEIQRRKDKSKGLSLMKDLVTTSACTV